MSGQSLVLLVLCFGGAAEQTLRIVPLTGSDGGPPAVRIEDASGQPIRNVPVKFELPSNGPGGSFGGGKLRRDRKTLTIATNDRGEAIAESFRPNKEPGTFATLVNATHDGSTTTATLRQVNPAGVVTQKTRDRGMAAAIFVLMLGAISLVTTLLAL
jgi:hypothetical protein